MDNKLLAAFAKSCRKSALEMVIGAQSGHPGGSLSCIDYLSLLYLEFIDSEPVVISNGHISPAVYSVLGHLKYFSLTEAVAGFRRIGSKFEGHVNRLVEGVCYGTGPLGIGVSVACGLALADRSRRVFALMGDGEAQEGQVHEMMHFAMSHKLGNLVLFVDANGVQLSDSVSNTSSLDVYAEFKAAGWRIKEVDGHNFSEMRRALKCGVSGSRPLVIIGKTVMGKGFSMMEKEGLKHRSTWHGAVPAVGTDLSELDLNIDEADLLDGFLSGLKKPKASTSKKRPLRPGNGFVYHDPTDCRSAYGAALKDLAGLNKSVVGLTADLAGSVKMNGIDFVECGIAEQNMLSVAGGMCLGGMVPFVSTFGAFMASR